MSLGVNQVFPIYNADGTSFHNLVLRESTYNSVVMGMADKITGEVLYHDNTLAVTMQEYIEYTRVGDNDAVKFVLVNPPTIVREGMVSDNGDLKGMTKYSFEFYHPMYMLSNLPFTDVAISDDEKMYLAQDKAFAWIGKLTDFVDKLNKNLQNTQWVVVLNEDTIDEGKLTQLSEVLTFDGNFISDALKTAYETWEVPFIIDSLHIGEYHDKDGHDYYTQNKRFVILFGLPSNEIIGSDDNPYLFRFGKGVGLKNNSRTPKNNKIITRIAGYGSEDNIPFGYPQILWYGDPTWNFTINNEAGVHDVTLPDGRVVQAMSYPIYKGIVGGQYVNLIKHPFTRAHLMPTIYVESLFNKVSQYLPPLTGTTTPRPNPDFDPDLDLVDYYDAVDDATHVYPHHIVPSAPSYEIHEFEKVKPELGDAFLASDAQPYSDLSIGVDNVYKRSEFAAFIQEGISSTTQEQEKQVLRTIWEKYENSIYFSTWTEEVEKGTYIYQAIVKRENDDYVYVSLTSSSENFKIRALLSDVVPEPTWDDTMDENGKYQQSHFTVELPALGFDLYACAAIPQEMQINMRSGACIGCTFNVMVDWEDYKRNFYNDRGEFDPVIHTEEGDGHVRDGGKYPDSTLNSITLILQKDIETFGTIMPSIYQQPKEDDAFVILGISLPKEYVTRAQERLDEDMKEYMLENNVYYYDYPIKIDEKFLLDNPLILTQIRNNAIFRFRFGNEDPTALYIKEMTIKYGSSILPQYDLTLTDDVEIVLNQIGQTTEDVSRLRLQVSELQSYYNKTMYEEIQNKLSKVSDDVAQGKITFQQGINAIGRCVFSSEIGSPSYTSGLWNGAGWKLDEVGNGEFESIRVRTFLEVVELLVNRLQAQEGDTVFTDNDQVETVEALDGYTGYYILSLKEKWDGYVTSQKEGNILKGIINTLAGKNGGVSDVDEDDQGTSKDGENSYYTSWMVVVDPQSVGATLRTNQIVVRLWGDNEGSPAGVPTGVNFAPCEFMTIARWGCLGNAQDPSLTPAQRADIERRQRTFYISTTDGRICKLRGVNQPILQDSNYGTTLGIIPDFIRNWTIASRLLPARDYLYAQGVIVGDFIKVDTNGDPLINYVDCGEWIDGASIAEPSIGHGIYLVGEYNEENLQWETHDVWHRGAKWRCLTHQPMPTMSGDVYAEPSENSPYWQKLLSSAADVRPNILRQSAFRNDELDLWYTHVGQVMENDFDGRNAFKGTNASQSANLDFLQQQVYDGGADLIETNTIYTLSFWAKSNADLEVHLYPSMIRSSFPIIVDGVEQAAGTSFATFAASAEYTYHTITFKTAATLSGGQYILFRIVNGVGNTASICMPKLERGQYATAYMENDLDLKGRMGRNPYYWGTWEDFVADNQNVFRVTDTETAYFSKLRSGSGTQRDYWIFVGANSPSGGYTASDVGAPSNTNANWEIMVSDFKYLITEAIFTALAKLGSAIFNEDFMYSQWGYQNDFEVQDEWQDFNPEHPDDDSFFNPNVYIDWRKGNAHFGAGKTYFHHDGSGHLANGNISWDANGNATFEGDIQAHSGIFSGFLLKQAFHITNDNYEEIGIRPTSGGSWSIPFSKIGSYVIFDANWYEGSGAQGFSIPLPSCNTSGVPTTRAEALQYIGSTMIIMMSDHKMPILLTGLFATSIAPQSFSTELFVSNYEQSKHYLFVGECRFYDGNVYWQYELYELS